MVVRSILPFRKVIKKPPRIPVPHVLSTLGDHIRKKRIESGLLQSDVAESVNVTEDTITNWENNRFAPQIQHYPNIFRFLGYYPFDHETEGIAGKLKQLRCCLGLSYEQCGEVFAVHASTIRAWELGHNQPPTRRQAPILARWQSLRDFLTHKNTQYENTEKIRPAFANVIQ